MKENQIDIEDELKLSDIEKRWTALFPYLKLEFYMVNGTDRFSPSHRIKDTANKLIRDCRSKHTSGVMTVFPEMSVFDLENIFFQSFGLSVQVLRKAGNIWQQTSHTDSWSLEEQNKQGEKVSTSLSLHSDKRRGQ